MGPTSSDDSKLLAKFAETRHLPYISYTASAPELSDAETYPNFMRTVAQDGPLTQVSSIKLYPAIYFCLLITTAAYILSQSSNATSFYFE